MMLLNMKLQLELKAGKKASYWGVQLGPEFCDLMDVTKEKTKEQTKGMDFDLSVG